MIYLIIFVLLLAIELCYFKVADHYNIIDKPNERSSHSSIVLRGGGIIFAISMIVWSLTPFPSPQGEGSTVALLEYLPFIIGLVLICGVSFWDDIHSLPDSVRLVAQFAAMALMLYSFMSKDSDFNDWAWYWQVLIGIAALIVCVGATNIINFMDGINGITGAYAFASLIPLALLNQKLGFVDQSLIYVVMLADVVFCFFNFRPKGKAKCFAGDVGSIGVAYILLFLIGCLIAFTQDVTYLIFLLVYGVDGCCTIIHRIMLHENLGEAHRKHAFQLMANELKIGHVKVSLLYMILQLAVSLGFIYICPDNMLCHWMYLIGAGIVLALAYLLFMKKYYHLHEEYLASLKEK